MTRQGTLRGLILRNMAISAVINAVFSVGFYIAVFGLPGRALTWGLPDQLALDFLPQTGMVVLMSAMVPPLVERRALAAVTGNAVRPVRAIVRSAFGFALCGVALGGLLAWLCSGLSGTIEGSAAFALKLAFGATLGAIVTAIALRPR